MNVAAWLNGLTCVAPFTLDDVCELYNTLKTELGKDSIVDVHMTPKPATVHVSVVSPTLKGRWSYAVA